MKDRLVLRLRKLVWLEGYAAMAVFLAIAAVVFFWDPLFTWSADKILAGGDIASQYLLWLEFIIDSLRQHGALPLWNPYLFSGAPLYANPQPMMFYPFTYLGMLMPVTRAMTVTLVIHLWLAGMGMYCWLRSLGATHAGAFLGGAAFAFTGTYSLRLGVGHYGILLQLAWWPLSFWALHIALERRSWRRAIVGGVPLAMALLSGHAATCLLLYLALGLYIICEAMIAYKQRGHWNASACVLGLAAVAIGMSVTLAAVQYLPLLNFSRATVRVNAGSADFASSFSAPIGHLVALIVPNFFGEVIRIGTWSVPGQQEITHYVGVLIFFLAILGVQLTRQRCLLFFLVLAVIALILQLGPDGVLFTFLYRFVPGFSMTRAPGRAGLIYTFAVVTVAGLVWSELEGAPQDTIKRLLGIFGRSLIWVVSALTVAAALLSFILYAIFTTNGPAWTWHLADQLTQFLVLFWATMALFTAWRNRSITQRTLNLLAVIVLVFDLWSYGLKSVRPGTDPVGPAWRDATNFVQRKLDYRVEPVGEIPFTQDDSPLAYRIRSHYGYDSLVLGRYQALLNSAPDYFDRVFDLLNVGYVIAQKPVEFKDSGPKLDLYNQTGSVWVYRRPNPLPRAFIVHEAQVILGDQEAVAALHAPEFKVARTVTLPLAPPCSLEPAIPSAEEAVQLVGESPDHLELTTHSERAGLLVLSEVDYPGWQASVDGQSVQVLRADTILRAVCLPAGSHTVRFDFQPRDLVVGAAISSLALVVVMGVIIERWISVRRVTRSR